MRATQLNYRNPKERTPVPYYPIKDNTGFPLNRFEYFGQSESLHGSFSKNHRFDRGSIYDYPFRSTDNKVGPGTYKDNDVVLNMKKKPCMSMLISPECGPNEAIYEMTGNLRVLCPSYLPRPVQANFDKAMHHYSTSRTRKINETFVYSRAVARTPNARNAYHSSRNLNFSHTMTPEMRHVSRIRASNDKKFRAKLREAGLLLEGKHSRGRDDTSPSPGDVMSADLYVANASAASAQYSKIKGRPLRKAGSRNDSAGDYVKVTADQQYMLKTGSGS